MDPTNPYARPEVTTEVPPEPRPLGGLRVVAIGLVTLIATTIAYVLGQLLVLRNLPLALILTSLFVFGAAGVVFPAIWNVRWARFTGLNRLPWKFVLAGVVLGLANFAVANFLMGLAQMTLPERWSDDAKMLTRILAGAHGSTALLVVLAAGVAAPIGEELFFRGWLQGLATQRFQAYGSVIVVAIIFSAIHFDAVGFVARVELGVLFGLMRLWSGSIWPGIAVHATHNTLSLAVMYLSPDPLAELDQPFPWQDSLPWMALALVATAFVVRRAKRLGESKIAIPQADSLNPASPPFTLRPSSALRIAVPIGVLGIAFALVIVLAGPKLPGANMLTLPSTPLRQLPKIPDPQGGSGHLE